LVYFCLHAFFYKNKSIDKTSEAQHANIRTIIRRYDALQNPQSN